MLPNVSPEVAAEASVLAAGGYDPCQYAVNVNYSFVHVSKALSRLGAECMLALANAEYLLSGCMSSKTKISDMEISIVQSTLFHFATCKRNHQACSCMCIYLAPNE